MPALPIVELRRYRLVPGGRDALVTLFEREFLESQDAVGAHVLGQFELQGEPDQFVWLRGFTGMQERKAALARFYDGPVWAEHGPKANATMIDSDDVHLLTVMTPADGFMRPSRPRRPKGARIAGGSRFVIVLYRLAEGEDAAAFDSALRRHLAETGIDPLASFETFAGANDYPRLPVHEGDRVHAVLMRFDSAVGIDAALAAPPPALAERLRAAPETLILSPTPRSLLR